MFELIFVTSRSAAFELANRNEYHAPAPFDVFLDGVLWRKDITTNIFSLFGLAPDHAYEINIAGDAILFRTDPETASVDVRSHGAKGDGLTDDTLAVQAAITSCPWGGRVWIPEGIYRVYPLFLKSGVTIELAKGAILLGQTDRKNYPVLPALRQKWDGSAYPLSSWEGETQPTCASVLTALEVRQARIIGEGIVDANAQHSDWWSEPRAMRDGAFRAKGIFFSQCDDIAIHGITLQNTPSWALHPFFCKNISYIDMKVINPKDSPNTDGCDPECCDGVRLLGVDFSVGDDCIAIKSGKFDLGMRYQTPSAHITIRNCRMADGHGAVVLGSEMSGGIRDLSVTRCLFAGTDRGLRIKTRRGRGESAVIDGVTFEQIRMDGVLTPFVINMYYFCDADGKTEYVWSKEKQKIDDRTPRLGKFVFRDIVCVNAQVAAGYFYGLPERPIGSVTIENVSVAFAADALPGYPAMMSHIEPMCKSGWFFRFVDQVVLKNVEVTGQDGPAVIRQDVKSFRTATTKPR